MVQIVQVGDRQVEFPDNVSREQMEFAIQDFQKQEPQQETAQPVEETGSFLEGVERKASVVGSGLGTGLEALLSTPGEVFNLGVTGISKVFSSDEFTDKPPEEQREIVDIFISNVNKSMLQSVPFAGEALDKLFTREGGKVRFFPEARDIPLNKALETKKIPREELTTGEKFLSTASEFVGSAPSPNKLTQIQNLVAAVGSESAGQLTEGTSLEPVARIVGAIASGTAAAKGTDILENAIQRRALNERFFTSEGVPTGELTEALRRNGIRPDDLTDAQKVIIGVGGAGENIDDIVRSSEFEVSGVRPTRSGITNDLEDIASEEQLAGTFTPEGDTLRALRARQAEQQIESVGDISQEALGQTPDLLLDTAQDVQQSAGLRIEETLDAAREAGERGIDAAFTDARAAAGTRAPIDRTPLEDVVRDLEFNDILELAPDSYQNFIKKKIEEFGLSGGSRVQLNVENSERLLRVLNANTPDSKAAKSITSRIRQAINESEVTTGNPEAKKLFKTAREKFSSFKDEFFNKDIVQKITNFKKGSDLKELDSFQIANKLVKNSARDNNLLNLKKIKTSLLKLGDEGKKSFNDLGSVVIANVLEAAFKKGGQTSRGGLSFDGTAFNKAVNSIGKPTLNLLLGKEGTKELLRLARISKKTNTAIGPGIAPSSRMQRIVGSLRRFTGFNVLGGGAKAGIGDLAQSAAIGASQKNLGKKALEKSQDLRPRLDSIPGGLQKFPLLLNAIRILGEDKE